MQGRLQLATPDEQTSDETLADPELAAYRAQLEQELAEDDLFLR
jgi:hypothetical protein